MPDSEETPVAGDGVVTLPSLGTEGNSEEFVMPEQVDLSPNVANTILTETTGNIQASNRNSRGVFDAAMGAIAGTVQTNFAEVGLVEGRTASGVLATPIAAPTTGRAGG